MTAARAPVSRANASVNQVIHRLVAGGLRDPIDDLEPVGVAGAQRVGRRGQCGVVVSASPAETAASVVECEGWDDEDVDVAEGDGGGRVVRRLEDAELRVRDEGGLVGDIVESEQARPGHDARVAERDATRAQVAREGCGVDLPPDGGVDGDTAAGGQGGHGMEAAHRARGCDLRLEERDSHASLTHQVTKLILGGAHGLRGGSS